MSNPELDKQLSGLPEDARVLDAGGWFNPLLAATHVVDLMPYETRRGQLKLLPIAGERFNKATWYQTNFLDPDLHLPYEDKYFAFVLCTHTIEDLADPQPLLGELLRVGHSGYFEFPSRIAEQTIGLRDRITSHQGHPHHHWIIDVSTGCLEFSTKSGLAELPVSRQAIPLSVYERYVRFDQTAQNSSLAWSGHFSYAIVPHVDAKIRATQLCDSLCITRFERIKDILTRNLRGIKWRVFLNQRDNTSKWWQEMLRLSRPYSTIPLI